MISLNSVFLAGNLTHTPELRHTKSGTPVSELRMAVNRRFKDRDGVLQEETCFIDVEVWSKQAESCCSHLEKGDGVLVQGRLKLDRWEKEGQPRSKLLVVGERVQFGAQRRD